MATGNTVEHSGSPGNNIKEGERRVRHERTIKSNERNERTDQAFHAEQVRRPSSCVPG